MSEVISQRELRNDSGRIMSALDEGRSFVVTRNTRARRRTAAATEAAACGRASGHRAFPWRPGVDREQFQRDVEVFADQDVNPRA